MSDQHIVDEVGSWERERIRLQHKRRMALGVSALVLCAAALISVGVSRCVPYTQARAAAAAEAAARRRADQEAAWRDCLHYLGPERCNAIEARLAERCLAAHTTTTQCLEWEVE